MCELMTTGQILIDDLLEKMGHASLDVGLSCLERQTLLEHIGEQEAENEVRAQA